MEYNIQLSRIFLPIHIFWAILTPFLFSPYTHAVSLFLFGVGRTYGRYVIVLCTCLSIANVRLFGSINAPQWKSMESFFLLFSSFSLSMLFSSEFWKLNRSHRNIIEWNHSISKIWTCVSFTCHANFSFCCERPGQDAVEIRFNSCVRFFLLLLHNLLARSTTTNADDVDGPLCVAVFRFFQS